MCFNSTGPIGLKPKADGVIFALTASARGERGGGNGDERCVSRRVRPPPPPPDPNPQPALVALHDEGPAQLAPNRRRVGRVLHAQPCVTHGGARAAE